MYCSWEIFLCTSIKFGPVPLKAGEFNPNNLSSKEIRLGEEFVWKCKRERKPFGTPVFSTNKLWCQIILELVENFENNIYVHEHCIMNNFSFDIYVSYMGFMNYLNWQKSWMRREFIMRHKQYGAGEKSNFEDLITLRACRQSFNGIEIRTKTYIADFWPK